MIKTVLGVDEYLRIVEEIFKKYLDIEQNNLTFVKFERYPIINKGILSKIKDNTLISNKPFAPYMCVACVKDMLLDRIYMDSSRDKSFKYNPFIPGGGRTDLVPDYDNDASIIYSYIDNIIEEDIEQIVKWVDKLYKENVKQIVNHYPDSLYDIDIETTMFILINLGNVKTYRYNELLEYSQNVDNSCCYKDSVSMDDYNKHDSIESRKDVYDTRRRNKHKPLYKQNNSRAFR